MLHKFSIVPSQPQKTSDIFHICRLRPLLNILDFLGIRSNTITTNNVSQILELLLSKGAFRQFNSKTMLLQELKHLLKDLKMTIPSGCIDQYVINKNNYTIPE